MRDILCDNAAVRSHFEDLYMVDMGFTCYQCHQGRGSARSLRYPPGFAASLNIWLCSLQIKRHARGLHTVCWLSGKRCDMEDKSGLTMIACLGNRRPLIPACSGMLSTQSCRQRPSLVSTHLETFCMVCQECDHNASQGAMAQLQPSAIRTSTPMSRQPGRSMGRICTFWNKGACTYPGSCSFRHVCSKCYQQSHRAKDCHAPARPRPSSPSGARVSQSSS